MRVPEGRAERFAANLAEMQQRAMQLATREAADRRAETARRAASVGANTVRNGESLWTTARRYDTTMRCRRPMGWDAATASAPGSAW